MDTGPFRGKITDGNCYLYSFVKDPITGLLIINVLVKIVYSNDDVEEATTYALSPCIYVKNTNSAFYTAYGFIADSPTLSGTFIFNDNPGVINVIKTIAPQMLKITYDINNKNYIIKGLNDTTVTADISIYPEYNITDVDLFASLPYKLSSISINEIQPSNTQNDGSYYPHPPTLITYYVKVDANNNMNISGVNASRNIFLIPVNYLQRNNQCNSTVSAFQIFNNYLYDNKSFVCEPNSFTAPNSKCVFTDINECDVGYYYAYCTTTNCGPCFGNCPSDGDDPPSDVKCKLYYPVIDGLSCNPSYPVPPPTPAPTPKDTSGNKYRKAAITTAIISASTVALILFLFYLFRK